MMLEWLVILLVALIVFGPKQLPEIAFMLGKWANHADKLKAQCQLWWQQELEKQQLPHREAQAKIADKLYETKDQSTEP